MMRIVNRAGFSFVLVDGTNFVEVFHPKASHPDVPLEVVKLGENPSQPALNRLANESREYARSI